MRVTALLLLLTILAFSCTPKQSNASNSEPKIEKLVIKVVSGGRIWSLDWSPDGKYIACGNSSGLLRIYEAESLELVDILTGFTFTINGIHWSPDGGKVVASGMYVKGISWHPNNREIAYLDRGDRLHVFSRQGEFLSSSKVEGDKPSWENGTPMAFDSEDDKFKFNQKVFINKDDRKLEIIPLNNQRFALVDSLRACWE